MKEDLMKIARRLAILAGLVMCGLAPDCPPDNSFRRQACCGDRNPTPPVPVHFSQQIATNAGDVPVELQRCRANLDEITAITISGDLVGCAGSESDVTFLNLTVAFTTDSNRCPGGSLGIRTPTVTLTDVRYRNNMRFGSPACVSNSSVTGYTFFTTDPAFATLFATSGPQTLLPILDRYVLGWGATIPARPSSPPSPATCPPRPILGGTTSRCPG